MSIGNVLVCAGYIDLSKRRVSAEEIQKCEETFSKAKTVSMLGVTPLGLYVANGDTVVIGGMDLKMVEFDQWLHADNGRQCEHYGKSSLELL